MDVWIGIGSQGRRLLASSRVVEFQVATAGFEGAGALGAIAAGGTWVVGADAGAARFPVAIDTAAAGGRSRACHLCYCHRVLWRYGYRAYGDWGRGRLSRCCLLAEGIFGLGPG